MIFEAFKRMRMERPEAAAFLITAGDRSVPVSWRQFTDDIDLVARLIRKHAPGAKVGILGENSYEWFVAHAALLFSGATVVPIDVNLNQHEIASRLKKVGAVMLVYSSLYAVKALATQELMPGLAVAAFGSLKTERFLDRVRRMLTPQDSIWNLDSVPTDIISMLVFTSGTTSEPRGAELTIRGLEEFCRFASKQLGMKGGQRSLMLLPLYHIFGVCVVYLMLVNGVALGICPDFRRIYDAVERFRVNFLFLVPALAEILAAKIDQHGRSAEEALGTPIDWILIGGAPLPRRTYEHLTALGIRMITGYGLTETCSLYSIAPAFGDQHVGSAGQAARLPGTETKVSPEGELLLRSPAVMRGYYRDPEHTARAIDADGWFHTGDLGRIDEDGFVWITGRASRTIVLSSGKKVAPEELEDYLLSIPGILEAVVSGEGESREIRAEVYGTISPESIEKAIGQLNLQLPVYKRVGRIVVRKEPFPRTSSGKIRVGGKSPSDSGDEIA